MLHICLAEAVVIAEGATDDDATFWIASAMFNRIDIKFYGDTKAWKIISRGWSGAYNTGAHKKYLNQTDKVDAVVRAVMNGARAHKYTDFACNTTTNPLANKWIANHPGERYECHKGNMYCDWDERVK